MSEEHDKKKKRDGDVVSATKATEIVEKFYNLLDNEKISKIAIVMHSNPDPDCIGAAVGISRLINFKKPEIKCEYWYSGEISHPQNKTIINVLNIAMTNMKEIEKPEEAADAFVCVDAMPERCFDKKTQKCLLVVDHHKTDTSNAEIADIRLVGATSSIVWEYIRASGMELHENREEDNILATALLIGIKTDTVDFTTESVSDIDFSAYKELLEYVDRRKLSYITNYPIPPYLFELRSQLDQEENIKTDNGTFVGGIGYITPSKRDAIPTLAEERARVEGIDTSFVFAIVGDNIEVCVRSVGLSVDVNGLCQKIFGREFAGGKMGSGAAKIPLGFLATDGSSDFAKKEIWEAVKSTMIYKIFHVMSGNV